MENKLKSILVELEKIEYGWADQYGVIHKKAGKDYFIHNYRLQSIDETLKYKVGTCWEQVEYVRFLLEKENIKCKSYIIIYSDENKIARHTIAVVNANNKYYLMESSWNLELKIFSKLDDIFNMFIEMFPKMYKINDFDISKIEIYEYTKPEEHLSYDDFTNFCKKCVRVK